MILWWNCVDAIHYGRSSDSLMQGVIIVYVNMKGSWFVSCYDADEKRKKALTH